tara:strand:- start:6443 stop:7228 length:786 start_codon:yes stop_codon:yes gene_type:complete
MIKSQERLTFLVTNDDGIEVYFLRALVNALSAQGNVYVAAPKQEQSWVGRKVSRHQEIQIEEYTGFDGAKAWAIDGTPTDAVNIALGHLLPKKPDVVVSGINVGFNALLPILLSSGTLAGALEGAGWEIPAVAFSIHLLAKDFNEVKLDQVNPTETVRTRVDRAAKLATDYTLKKVGEGNEDCQVDNVNFPSRVDESSKWIATQPGKIKIGSFFERRGNDTFRFRYSGRATIESRPGLPNDWDTFNNGNISVSTLKFNKLA